MIRLAPHAVVIALALIVAALCPAPEREPVPDATREAGIRMLGAARGYATTALWLRAGDSYRRGDYYETLAAYQLIQQLQPRNPAVYSYLSWNQGYNISAPFPGYDERLEWVLRGLHTLHEGQDRLPHDVSLRMDEWHYVLNRSAGYLPDLVNAQLPRYQPADKGWSVIVAEQLAGLLNGLSPAQRDQMQVFLREVGAHTSLFRVLLLDDDARRQLLDPAFDQRTTSQQGELGREFPQAEREMFRAFFALDAAVQEALTLAHWCRAHLMTLILVPALAMDARSPALEISLINSYVLSWQYFPAGGRLAQHFLKQYQEGVASALRAGIENARRRAGDEGVNDFLAHARENLADTPELLPGHD